MCKPEEGRAKGDRKNVLDSQELGRPQTTYGIGVQERFDKVLHYGRERQINNEETERARWIDAPSWEIILQYRS